MSYFVWLIPDEPHLSMLQHKIADLAKCYNSPRFYPHITLCSFPQVYSLNDINLSPLDIELLPPQHSSIFFRNIFHPINNFNLRQIQEDLEQNHNGKIPDLPHLSLLYGNLHRGTGFDLCQGLGSKQINIRCSTLVLVQGSAVVEDWMIIAQKKL